MKKILILPYHIDDALKQIDYFYEGILEELLLLISFVPSPAQCWITWPCYLSIWGMLLTWFQLEDGRSCLNDSVCGHRLDFVQALTNKDYLKASNF